MSPRIVSGTAGGRRLRTPAGAGTRPTSDRVKEALFSALEAQLGALTGRRFLDVFAGSGAIGLEARSRGASHVTLMERDPAAASLIRANAKALGLDNVAVVSGSAGSAAARAPEGGGYDVCFLDPPYATSASQLSTLLVTLGQAGWLHDGALVVLERSRRDGEWIWPEGFEPLRSKKYGETMLWYGRVLAG
jgi:16S rRNA (guanine966-N2)-methyltransferase